MVARGMVREAHAALEALQARLKEIRDRLDRVSREEAHYLELATLEHKLLQVCSSASASDKLNRGFFSPPPLVPRFESFPFFSPHHRKNGVCGRRTRLQKVRRGRSLPCSQPP